MDRGQAHTLEGFTAALLLVSGVIFALQATAVTPLSASTSNQHIQNQQRLVANDLLSVAAANGSLREAVLFWNTTEGEFDDAGSNGYYTVGGPPNRFGELLEDTFLDDRIAFNVYVAHRDGAGWSSQTMVLMGSPSDNAVSATRTLTLYNDSRITAPGSEDAVANASVNGEFYASDVAPGSELFNVMEVRIVVWRM